MIKLRRLRQKVEPVQEYKAYKEESQALHSARSDINVALPPDLLLSEGGEEAGLRELLLLTSLFSTHISASTLVSRHLLGHHHQSSFPCFL